MSSRGAYHDARPASLRLHIPSKDRARSRSDTMVRETPELISAELVGRELIDFVGCPSRQSYDSDSGIDSGMSGSWSVDLDKQRQSASARPLRLNYRPQSHDSVMDETPRMTIASPGDDDGVFSASVTETPGLSKDFSSLLVGQTGRLSPRLSDSPTSSRSKSTADVSPTGSNDGTPNRRVGIRRHHTISSCTSAETDKAFLWEKILSWEVTSSSLATYNSTMWMNILSPPKSECKPDTLPFGITPFSMHDISVSSADSEDFASPCLHPVTQLNEQMNRHGVAEDLSNQNLQAEEKDCLKVSGSKRVRRPSGDSNSSATTTPTPGTPKRLRVASCKKNIISPYQLIPRPICGQGGSVTPKNENDGNDLIGDLSRRHTLPLLPGKRDGCKRISTETLRNFLLEKENSMNFTIIDCRYPYEYAGGHIKGALNLYTKDTARKHLFSDKTECPQLHRTSHILIFHCEFSIKRGPDMCKYIRSFDRELNTNNYPRLFYPEIYVLENGYKDFYSSVQSLCEPCGYVPMMDRNHCDEMEEYDSLVLRSNKHKSSDDFQKNIGRRLFVRHRTCLNF